MSCNGGEAFPADVSDHGAENPESRWRVYLWGDNPMYFPTLDAAMERINRGEWKHRWCRFVEEPPKP